MANVNLTVSVVNQAIWLQVLPKLAFYAEEADIRLDTGQPVALPDGAVGVVLKTSAAHASRLAHILLKAGLDIALEAKLILPQDDPEEVAIQEKLYPGGDTSKKLPIPTERPLMSDSESYYMTAEAYSDYMRGLGRRGPPS